MKVSFFLADLSNYGRITKFDVITQVEEQSVSRGHPRPILSGREHSVHNF